VSLTGCAWLVNVHAGAWRVTGIFPWTQREVSWQIRMIGWIYGIASRSFECRQAVLRWHWCDWLIHYVSVPAGIAVQILHFSMGWGYHQSY